MKYSVEIPELTYLKITNDENLPGHDAQVYLVFEDWENEVAFGKIADNDNPFGALHFGSWVKFYSGDWLRAYRTTEADVLEVISPEELAYHVARMTGLEALESPDPIKVAAWEDQDRRYDELIEEGLTKADQGSYFRGDLSA